METSKLLNLIEKAICNNESIDYLFNKLKDICSFRMANNACIHKENDRGCISGNCPYVCRMYKIIEKK